MNTVLAQPEQVMKYKNLGLIINLFFLYAFVFELLELTCPDVYGPAPIPIVGMFRILVTD